MVALTLKKDSIKKNLGKKVVIAKRLALGSNLMTGDVRKVLGAANQNLIVMVRN